MGWGLTFLPPPPCQRQILRHLHSLQLRDGDTEAAANTMARLGGLGGSAEEEEEEEEEPESSEAQDESELELSESGEGALGGAGFLVVSPQGWSPSQRGVSLMAGGVSSRGGGR